ncbi:MAG: ROK family protein [Phycisphaerae bacterium]|nr:ROK family protein [Phycisphaerae bacterium]
MGSKPVCGIDLGGTNIQIGVVGPKGRLLGESKKKTKADEGQDAILSRLIDGVDEACAAAGIARRDLAAIGIGAPGAIDPDAGVVLEAVNLRWTDMPLASVLSRRAGVPVVVDNDVNVAVWGEYRYGSGRGASDILGVWCGTGIGGGLILDNRLYYGRFKTAGEIGHTILLPQNPPGSRSLEHNCSRTAVVERIVRLIRANRKSALTDMCEGDYDKIKSRMLGKAYADGDALTVEVVDSAAELLGISIAGVVTLLSLERIILGGGLVEALGKPFVEGVQKSVKRHVFPDRCRKVEVVASELEDHAGVLGAAAIAVERLNLNGKD